MVNILCLCVFFRSFWPHELRVIVGQGSLSVEDSEEMAFDIESTTVHPNWDQGVLYSNDIALVKLRRKGNGQGIDFSEKVGPVCLPSYDSPQKPGTECVVSGWGKTDGKSSIARPKPLLWFWSDTETETLIGKYFRPMP